MWFLLVLELAPGRFRPDPRRENLDIGPLAGRGPAGEPMLRLIRLESNRNPGRKPDFWPGSTFVKAQAPDIA